MATSSVSSLLVFVVMVGVTFWFTNIMIRALDILYKPSVKQWIHNKDLVDDNLNFGQQDTCSKSDSCNNRKDSSENLKEVVNDLAAIYDDEYLEQLRKELVLLKAMRGRMNIRELVKRRHSVRNNKLNHLSYEDKYCYTEDQCSNIPPFFRLE